MVLATAGAAAAMAGNAIDPVDTVARIVGIFAQGGGWAVAVAAGWWAWRKDRERTEASAKHHAARDANQNEVTAMAIRMTEVCERNTAAMGKAMETMTGVDQTITIATQAWAGLARVCHDEQTARAAVNAERTKRESVADAIALLRQETSDAKHGGMRP
jgi:hypothetical protein